MPFNYWEYMQSISPRNMTFDDPGSSSWQGNDYEYGGGSDADFYEYLMTPRHQKRWSGSGAIKHFGPDRYASIRPEDAAMAEMLLKQMEAKDIMAMNKETRASDLERRRAADAIMMPEGQGGGTIQFSGAPQEGGGYSGPRGTKWGYGDVALQVGGGLPEGPPQGPPLDMTDAQGMLAAAGGYKEQPSAAAAVQGEGYAKGQQGGKVSNADIRAFGKAKADLARAENILVTQLPEKHPLAGKTGAEIVAEFQKNPDAIPPHMRRSFMEYMVTQQEILDSFPQFFSQQAAAPGGGGMTDEAWSSTGR
jgi:hypothetical protein